MMRSPPVRTSLNNIILGAGVGEVDNTYNGICRLISLDFTISDLEQGIYIGDMFQ